MPTIRAKSNPTTTEQPPENRQTLNNRQIIRERPIQKDQFTDRYRPPPAYSYNRRAPPRNRDSALRNRREKQQLLQAAVNRRKAKYSYLPTSIAATVSHVRATKPSYEPVPLEPEYMASFNSEFRVPTQVQN